jgi:hypothetical protein
MVVFFFGSPNSPILRASSGELAIVAVIAGLTLAVKAAGRLVQWTYYLPAVMVALWSVGLLISDAAPEVKREKLQLQSIADFQDIQTKMKDPTFLMNLKPPISSTCRSSVLAALSTGERTRGISLTSAEVHAILTNLGSDPDVESFVASARATSVDDLQWLALHGDESTRVSVGQNAHTPPATRRRLMDDPDARVSYSIGVAAASRLCDPEVIRIFWQRESSKNLPKDDVTYRQLAANACTPKDILRKLKTFPDPVGASAAATLHSLSAR